MLRQAASLIQLDFAPEHRQPSASRLLLATVAPIAGSLAAGAILVAVNRQTRLAAVRPLAREHVPARYAAPQRRLD
jgi:hypothetical protein